MLVELNRNDLIKLILSSSPSNVFVEYDIVYKRKINNSISIYEWDEKGIELLSDDELHEVLKTCKKLWDSREDRI